MEPSPTDFYEYPSLGPQERGFRLALLQPATTFNTEIQCELIEATLENHPPYEAVSYVWGIRGSTQPIIVDKKTLLVTQNLELALRYLRKEDETRTLWVDAICIDQHNLAEKSGQVNFMREIYTNCTTDLMWFGKSTPEIEHAIMLANQLKNLHFEYDDTGGPVSENDARVVVDARIDLANHGQSRGTNSTSRSPPRERDSSVELVQRKSFESFSTERDLTSSIISDDPYRIANTRGAKSGRSSMQQRLEPFRAMFLKPPLWKRVWVMQEVACAPTALFVFGHQTMSWDVVAGFLDGSPIADAFHAPFSHSIYERQASKIFAHAQVLEHQRSVMRKMRRGEKSPILDVFSRFRDTEASDPRDKIYALLGLTSDDLGIVPDYTKSIADVYRDFTCAYINWSHNLDILSQSQWPIGLWHTDRVADLPSWVPDFSSRDSSKILFAQRQIFSAGSTSIKTSISQGEANTIALQGFDLGFLASIASTIHDRSNESLTLFRAWMPLQVWASSSTYFTGEPTFRAYCRTLMLDCTGPPIKRLSVAEIDQRTAAFKEWRSGGFMDPKYDRLWTLIADAPSWRFAISDQGFYCMVPWDASEHDRIVVLHGAKVPVVLRSARLLGNWDPTTEKSIGGMEKYKFVGPAYVHAFMDGRARQWAEAGKLDERSFALV